jgi:hypothetical protein
MPLFLKIIVGKSPLKDHFRCSAYRDIWIDFKC